MTPTRKKRPVFHLNLPKQENQEQTNFGSSQKNQDSRLSSSSSLECPKIAATEPRSNSLFEPSEQLTYLLKSSKIISNNQNSNLSKQSIDMPEKPSIGIHQSPEALQQNQSAKESYIQKNNIESADKEQRMLKQKRQETTNNTINKSPHYTQFSRSTSKQPKSYTSPSRSPLGVRTDDKDLDQLEKQKIIKDKNKFAPYKINEYTNLLNSLAETAINHKNINTNTNNNTNMNSSKFQGNQLDGHITEIIHSNGLPVLPYVSPSQVYQQKISSKKKKNKDIKINRDISVGDRFHSTGFSPPIVRECNQYRFENVVVREFNTTQKTRSNKFDVEGKRPIFKVSKRVVGLKNKLDNQDNFSLGNISRQLGQYKGQLSVDGRRNRILEGNNDKNSISHLKGNVRGYSEKQRQDYSNEIKQNSKIIKKKKINNNSDSKSNRQNQRSSFERVILLNKTDGLRSYYLEGNNNQNTTLPARVGLRQRINKYFNNNEDNEDDDILLMQNTNINTNKLRSDSLVLESQNEALQQQSIRLHKSLLKQKITWNSNGFDWNKAGRFERMSSDDKNDEDILFENERRMKNQFQNKITYSEQKMQKNSRIRGNETAFYHTQQLMQASQKDEFNKRLEKIAKSEQLQLDVIQLWNDK